MFDNLVDNKEMKSGFKGLSQMQRMVILLNLVMDFNLEETADIIGVTLNCTKAQKSNALKRLKNALEKTD